MRSRLTTLLLAITLRASGVEAQKPAIPLPPGKGLSMVQTLATPTGDRESLHTIEDISATGLRWIWSLVEVSNAGDTVRQEFKYGELDGDIRDAKRFWAFHDTRETGDHPGYTMHAISRATYRQIVAARPDSFQIMAIETPQGGGIMAGLGGGRPTPVRWKGILSLASPSPVPFPLLVNGQRVTVQALHLRGQLAFRDRKWTPEFWILADSAYPMLLKWVGAASEPTNILQTTRIDFPSTSVETQLTKECRADLPGIYFAFNSAVLDSTSNRSIASVADILTRHPDWSLTLEGHTDNVGSAGANRTLSERRVAAVKSRLVTAHRIAEGRLRAAGFGSERPREPNTTIEGRARNRRVELVRECGKP
jgi:outer membrane protein OmpA-like peptidoglycan-associated protein